LKKKTIVLDASVLRASGEMCVSGEIETKNHTAVNCRAAMESIRSICHRVAITPKIREEWDKHQSSFARSWRVKMVSICTFRDFMHSQALTM
jgi:hypothetical protein